MALIELTGISRIYGEDGGGTPALRNVTLNIEKGEFVAVMGPSGSGKSTLLHILGLLDRPTSGAYRFSETPVTDFSDDELAHLRNRSMGFVFQAFNLLPRASVRENVLLPLLYSGAPESTWEKRADEVIKTVGLSHRSDYAAATLSGGEKQRAAIARALVANPDVIFADEPTGNLDSKSGGMVMETIRDLHGREGRTIILITHETYAASYAGRVVSLKDGEVVNDTINDDHRARRAEGYKK